MSDDVTSLQGTGAANCASSEAPTIPAPPAYRGKSERLAYGHYVINTHPDGSAWVLGRGGMGVTFKATDTNLRCPVALKIISPQCFGGESSKRCFLREARLAAQIRHPNVAAIHHLDHENGQYFYAMEFVDGITAEKWVQQQGRMVPELALDIVMQIARALTAADRLKVVHRDIKPANIMILPDPANRSRVIAKLIDFGLARSIAGEASPTATTCGFTGTPQFASPEQAENLELDVRSDIYSLGSTLWFLLVGEVPFVGTPARVIAQLLTCEPPWERVKVIPKEIVRLLRSMLAKDPADRVQTPVELHDEISRCREAVAAHHARSGGSRRGGAVANTGYGLPSAAFAGVMVLVLVWIALSPRSHENIQIPPVAMAPGAGETMSTLPRKPEIARAEGSASKPNDPASPPAQNVEPVTSLLTLERSGAERNSFLLSEVAPDTEAAISLGQKDPLSLTLAGVVSDTPGSKGFQVTSPANGVATQDADSRGNGKRRGSRQQRHASPWQALDKVRGSIQGFVRHLF